RRASASRRRLRRQPLRHRAAQAARPDLEARALRGRHTRVGRSNGVAALRMTTTLKDQFGRGIEYLRISVTDRCNFRCLYCMPAEGLQWLPKQDILSYEEIAAVVQQLAPLGLCRLRITGGEPTIRPQLDTLVRLLKSIPEISDIALSTNGVRLPELAPTLRGA